MCSFLSESIDVAIHFPKRLSPYIFLPSREVVFPLRNSLIAKKYKPAIMPTSRPGSKCTGNQDRFGASSHFRENPPEKTKSTPLQKYFSIIRIVFSNYAQCIVVERQKRDSQIENRPSVLIMPARILPHLSGR